MSQYIQTNGDYTVKTRSEGIITLDTGANVGEVRVTGNLVVEGDTLTVSAENLNVNDNVIILNNGETGAGVTLRYSGIQIDRGTLQPAAIVYDENSDVFNIGFGSAETGSDLDFIGNAGEQSAIRVKRILTNPDTDNGDLILIGTGSGVVKVAGTTNYENQVTDDDDIPNKKYVDDAVRDNPTFQIVDDNTRVIVTDVDVSGSETFFTSTTGFSTFGESAVSVVIDGSLIAQFYNNRLEVGDLELGGGADRNEISLRSSITNENLYFRTQGTGKVQVNYGIQLEKISSPPTFVADSVILNAQDPSTGDTGLFYVNSDGGGELISKNRALLFSMIF